MGIIIQKHGGGTLQEPRHRERAISRVIEAQAGRGVYSSPSQVVAVFSNLYQGTNDLFRRDVESMSDKLRRFFSGARGLFYPVEDAIKDIEARAEMTQRPDYLEHLVASGEHHTSRLFRNAMPTQTQWINPENLRILGEDRQNGNYALEDRLGHLVYRFPGVSVVPGYIGIDSEGYSMLAGREGSDRTATELAGLLSRLYPGSVEEVTIFKDTAVLPVDPKYLREDVRERAKQNYIRALGVEAAKEMTRYGATVLHPETLAPIEGTKIPVVIRNIENPYVNTRISSTENKGVVAITGKSQNDGYSVIAVIGSGLNGEVAERFTQVLAASGISHEGVKNGGSSVRVYTQGNLPTQVLQPLYESLVERKAA